MVALRGWHYRINGDYVDDYVVNDLPRQASGLHFWSGARSLTTGSGLPAAGPASSGMPASMLLCGNRAAASSPNAAER